MIDRPEDGIRIEATEVVVDYGERFADQLRVLEQQVYEFRHRRGLKEGQEDVGVFAQHEDRRGGLVYTAGSAHAGHVAIEYPGRSVVIDFSQEEETLRITVDGQESSIDADAAGTSILADIQRRLTELEIDSLRLQE